MTGSTHKGLLEFQGHAGGYLRQNTLQLEPSDGDPHAPAALIHRYKLREGCFLEVTVTQRGRHGAEVNEILRINGMPPTEWSAVEEFSGRTAINPYERIRLASPRGEVSMRIVDLLCPLGKGQRALIVAPPRSGKTILMQQFAQAVSINHPEIELIVLLVDERPEEVTDMRRTIHGEVFASSSDSDRQDHVRLARLVLEYAKRKVEAGKDVVLLLDSLTKMGRAFNAVQRSSGRTMSGGVDVRALEIPKRIFGAARALEGGGSLTIIATALIETNSRMDELIFEEFKGTGNMELVLNRDLANDRIFPAVNIPASGTRREELLFGNDTREYQMLRRMVNRMRPKEAMLNLLKLTKQYPTNRGLLSRLAKEGLSE